jgi:glycosyltransferase involved in cell wall biosynthesis
MRITFVVDSPSISGGVKVVAIYASALVRMGHTVCIISTPHRNLSLAHKLRSWVRGRGWPRNPMSPKSYLDDVDLDHRVLERWRPVTDRDVPDGNIVIATWWETAEWVSRLASSKGAKVYFVQGHEVFPHLPVQRCHATYRLPMHKIVVAQWLKNVMCKQYGDWVVDVVPNSVDRSQFSAIPRGKQVVPTAGFLYAAGRLKGVDVTLAALRAVHQRFPDLRLLSFGSHRPTSQLVLPDWVEFFHLPPQAEIKNIYAQCDVWITASRSEGFNLPALEAMACFTPVVATSTGWPAEAVSTGYNGVLVDIEDEQGLARGIEWVLSRSDREWRELSANAYATSAVGSWQESAEKFEKALEHACRRSARREIAGTCA